MELINKRAKQLERSLKYITVKKVLQNVDVSEMHNPPLPEPYFENIMMLEFFDSEGYSFTQYFKDFVSSLREELQDNLNHPAISKDRKTEYLEFIKKLYTDVEEKIEIDDAGNYFSSLIKYDCIKPIEFSEIDNSIFQNFLIDFKNSLRDEIKNIAIIENKFSGIKVQNSSLKWNKSDTDLLELIVSLLETDSLRDNNDRKLSRKDTYKLFEDIFGLTLKDAESKLTRATERKMKTSPFLTSLKDAFDNYCTKKENKNT